MIRASYDSLVSVGFSSWKRMQAFILVHHFIAICYYTTEECAYIQVVYVIFRILRLYLSTVLFTWLFDYDCDK